MTDISRLQTDIYHLQNENNYLKQVIRELVLWAKSEEVQGAFTSAWVHGYRTSPEVSKKAQEMFERAKATIEISEGDINEG